MGQMTGCFIGWQTHPPSMAREVNNFYLHYRLSQLILKVQLSVQAE